MNDYISNRTIHTHDVGTYVTHGGAHPISIVSVLGRSILDSRGFPTVQVDLELADGTLVSGAAPAGASTGAHEAVELRDGGAAFGGKGVRRAAEMVTTEISDLLTSRPWAGGRVQLVGDDLYVTDPERIAEGAEKGWSDAVLIKPNQIGSVSQTLDAIATARSYGMACMVSRRSGETTDTFIADLVVGTGVGQIKSGAPARGERVCKYNRLTDIEADQPGLPYGLSTKDDA
ncbi:hypothetical protein [Frigoribacterium faeni]|uniref:hypothetical protein n=1 Tax=Frigoribacterium faeni TaxID=145483 RepID=UPI0027E15523|nr:hypothetical protein [Frigoribacterium faeni]